MAMGTSSKERRVARETTPLHSVSPARILSPGSVRPGPQPDLDREVERADSKVTLGISPGEGGYVGALDGWAPTSSEDWPRQLAQRT